MKNHYKLFILVGIVISISLGIIFGIKTSQSILYENSYKDDQMNKISYLAGKSSPVFTIPESNHHEFITSNSWRHPSMPSSIDKLQRVPTVYSFFDDGTFEIQWMPEFSRPDVVGVYKIVPFSDHQGIIFTIQNDNIKQVIPYEIRGEDRIIINYDYLGRLDTKYELRGNPPTQFLELLDEQSLEETFPLWFGINNSTWKNINPKQDSENHILELEFFNGKYSMKTSDGEKIEGPYSVFDDPRYLLNTYELIGSSSDLKGITTSTPLTIKDNVLTFGEGKYSVKLEKQS